MSIVSLPDCWWLPSVEVVWLRYNIFPSKSIRFQHLNWPVVVDSRPAINSSPGSRILYDFGWRRSTKWISVRSTHLRQRTTSFNCVFDGHLSLGVLGACAQTVSHISAFGRNSLSSFSSSALWMALSTPSSASGLVNLKSTTSCYSKLLIVGEHDQHNSSTFWMIGLTSGFNEMYMPSSGKFVASPVDTILLAYGITEFIGNSSEIFGFILF